MRHVLRLSGKRHVAAEFDGEEAETTAWVAEVVNNGGSVSSGRRTIVNDLIVDLKADSLWTKLDRLWLFAAEDEESALTDLVGLSLATSVNSVSFAVDEGYTGNGSTSYIDSNFNLATAPSPKFTQNSASIGLYDRTDRTADDVTAMMGVSGVSATSIWPLALGGVRMGVTTSSLSVETNAQAKGSYLATRTASNLTTIYKNGSSVGTDATDSAAVPELEVIICALNNGAAANHATDQVAGAWIGEGFDATQAANLATHINTYMTAVGANVY